METRIPRPRPEPKSRTASKTSVGKQTKDKRRTRLQRPLIRIVDDDASVRDALVYMLEQERFDTVAYASAEEFLVNDMPSRPGVRSCLYNFFICVNTSFICIL